MEQSGPHWGYEHVPKDVRPALREAGVSQADIDTMTTANPKKIFSRQEPY